MTSDPKIDLRTDIHGSYLHIIHQRSGEVVTLCQDNKAFDDAVHEIRKTIKKLRAVIQLLKCRYRNNVKIWDNSLKQVNLGLSKARDTAVFKYTFNKHFTRDVDDREKDWLQILEKLYEQERKHIIDENVFQDVAGKVKTLDHCLNEVPIENVTPDDLLDTIVDSYERAKKRFKKLKKGTGSEFIHPFRKSVKRLQYQIEILPLSENSPLFIWLGELDKLTDYLGDFNDVDVFCNWLRGLDRKTTTICKQADIIKKRELLKILESGAKVMGWKRKKFDKIIKEEFEEVPE